jgi:hypothetical protein
MLKQAQPSKRSILDIGSWYDWTEESDRINKLAQPSEQAARSRIML